MASKLRVTLGGTTQEVHVDRQVVRLGEGDEAWTVERRPDGSWLVTGPDGHVWRGAAVKTAGAVWVQVEGLVADARVESASARPRARATEADALRPPMPATVVRVMVSVGTTVAEGDTLLVLEAMKMELPIRAPRAGVVKAVFCREGELVQPDQVLADLE